MTTPSGDEPSADLADRMEQAVEAFAKALVSAGEYYLENRLYTPLLPNWNRIVAAVPEVMDWLEVLPYKDHKAVLG